MLDDSTPKWLLILVALSLFSDDDNRNDAHHVIDLLARKEREGKGETKKKPMSPLDLDHRTYLVGFLLRLKRIGMYL
jgi:hypothetical protein